SAKLDAAIVSNGNFHLHDGTGTAETLHAVGAPAPLPSTIALDSTGLIATLTPNSPLKADTAYTPMLKKATADEKGNTLADNVLWSFTTKKAAVPVPPTPAPPVGPKVVSVLPAAGAVGV